MSEWIPLNEIPEKSQTLVMATLQYYQEQDLKKERGLGLNYRYGITREGPERIYVRRSVAGTLEIMTMESGDEQ